MKNKNMNFEHTDATRETQDGPSDYFVIPWSRHNTIVALCVVAAFYGLLMMTIGLFVGSARG